MITFTRSSRLVLIQNWNDALIDLNIIAAQYPLAQTHVKRFEQFCCALHPITHRGGFQVHASAGEDCYLTVQRQMILIFAYEQLRQQRRPGIALGKRKRRKLPDDDPLAAEQGILGTYQTADIELSGLVFQQFGNFLPDAFASGRNLIGFDELVPTL